MRRGIERSPAKAALAGGAVLPGLLSSGEGILAGAVTFQGSAPPAARFWPEMCARHVRSPPGSYLQTKKKKTTTELHTKRVAGYPETSGHRQLFLMV